ncbi:MAG: hypothetical protein WBX11_04620 [Thiobacillaceae bacterium]
MDAAADPRLLAQAMLAGLNPKTYLSYMQGMSDPQALRNWLAMMTPQSTLDKAYSETDPEFQTALLSRVSGPKLSSGKPQIILDPAYFQSGVYVSSKPMQWVNVIAGERTAASMMNWFDPRLYMGWMRLMNVPHFRATTTLPTANATSAPKPMLFGTPPQRYRY